MYDRQPCFTDDSYKLSYEHLRQLECAGLFRAPTEVSPFKFVSVRQQVSDGEKECFGNGEDVKATLEARGHHICSVSKDMEFRMRTDDISSVFSASVLDCGFNSSVTAEASMGTEVVEIFKRPSSHLCDEVVNKRARQDSDSGKLEHFDGNSYLGIPSEGKLSEKAVLTRATADVGVIVKSFEGYEVDHQFTRLDQLEHLYLQFSDHFHWRHVPVGPGHQADLPKWTSRVFDIPSCNAITSYADRDEVSADKWLGKCIIPMPDCNSIVMEVRSCDSKRSCDCTDRGAIKCVRKHVMEAREKLIRALGRQEFIQMGFAHMGEIVAQRWTEEEENLFHEVVLSNPESAGRNFWTMLRKAFPSSSFKDLVSYYFNVFMLRKRAHQNRFDRSNVDSDNDEWQEMSEKGGEEEDSADESPSDVEFLAIKNVAFEVEYKEHPSRTEEEEGFQDFESKSKPAIQTTDSYSTDSAEAQDVQDDPCTSYDGLNNVSGAHGFAGQCNHWERNHANFVESRNAGTLNLADYEHTDGHGDPKPWKINNAGAKE